MSKKEKNPFNEIFALNFIGLEMEIMLNLYSKSEQGDEHGTLMEQNPLALRGYILDIDQDWVYMGDTPDSITKFIRKDMIAGGNIVKSDDGFDDILENLPARGSGN